MRYFVLILTAAALFLLCRELNNPFDASSDAGRIAQAAADQDTSVGANATINVVFDTANNRTVVVVTFDSTRSDTLFDTLGSRVHVDTTHYIDSVRVFDTLVVQQTSYDTIIFQDSVTLTRYDTLHFTRNDTSWVTKYDTVTFNRYDTSHVVRYDTTRISHYDTTHVSTYDTTHITQYDTTHIVRYDTVYINPKPHLSFLGLINTGGAWSVTLDTLFPKACTLYTNDYRYGQCYPFGSANPANCYTMPSEMISLFFTFKFSCPSCDSLRYYMASSTDAIDADTSDQGVSLGYTTSASSVYYSENDDAFHFGPGVYPFRFSARCVAPYSTPLADWRYLTIIVKLGPGPGGSPGTMGKVLRSRR